MSNAVTGRNYISGTWGKFWWDGTLIMEVKSLEAKVTTEREDVYVGINKV